MPLFQFFLGSHRSISWAELRAIGWGKRDEDKNALKIENLFDPRYNDLLLSKDTLLIWTHFDGKKADERFSKQAGSFKVARVHKMVKRKIQPEDIQDILLDRLLPETSNKIVLNFYGDIEPIYASSFRKEIKRLLKEKRYNIKILGDMKKINYNTATTTKVLRQKGHELNITYVKQYNLSVISLTEWVQDYRLWETLDFERPERDMKIGMLPSKLARIMLNLAKIDKNSGFWDPFVGLGTIIMQGQLLEAYSYGSDIDQEVLQRAERNIAWLLKRGLVSELRYRLFRFDARQDPRKHKMLRSIIRHGRFDAIVTEGYLGEPQVKPFANKKHVKKAWISVASIYKEFLKNQLPALNIGARVVLCVPMYRYKADGGYRWFVPKLPYNANRYREIKYNTGKLYWYHKDTIIGRKIVILERIK